MRGRPTKDPHTRPAINTLERLHAELGGQILENRQRYDELSHQMLRHVEAVIKMLDAGYNLAQITVSAGNPTSGSSAALCIDGRWTCSGRLRGR
jgi:hypothetical protein